MKRLTVSLEKDHVRELDAREHLGEADSRSAAVRQIFDEYEDLHREYATLEGKYEDLHARYEARGERIDQLHDRVDAREERVETLEEQLRERSRVEEKIEDLPDKLRGAETYTERRQRKLDEAGLLERVRWKFTGVPVDDVDGAEK